MKRFAPICLTLLALATVAPAGAVVPAGFDQLVIFVLDELKVKKASDPGSAQIGGDVVANEAGSEVKIEGEVSIGGDLYGDDVEIKKDATVAGTVFAGTLDNKGTIGGTGPYTPPVFSPLPPFVSGSAGTVDVEVPKNGSQELAPGAYGDIEVDKDAVLNLAGGLYNVRSITLEEGASLTYDQLTQVTVSEKVKTKKEVTIAPVAPAVASDLAIYVAWSGGGKAVELDQDNVVMGSIWAVDGEVKIKKETEITGAVLARELEVDKDVTFTLATFFFNRAPLAGDDAYATDEDTTLNVAAPGVLANDTDFDGDPLSAVLVADAANGTLTLNADGSFDYTPDADFNGSDAFTYQATDGGTGSNVATVTITVDAVNDAPTAADDAYSTGEDTALNVAAPGVLTNDADVDGDALTAALVADVANGSLTLNADGSFDYTPDADFNGSDSFTYNANDGALDSNVATVTITVTAVNDAPTAADDAYSTDEDTALNVAAPGVLGNDADVDGDALTAALVSDVSNGSLTLNADGSFDYTPDADFNGSDTFTYNANDGALDSNVATVTITVTAVNDAPTAADDAYSTDEDTALNVAAPGVLANDADVDGDALSAVLVSDVSNGSLTLNTDGSFDYTPDLNFNGSDSFTYKANDGAADSNDATVTITVNPVDDAPTAVDDAYAVDEGGLLEVPAPGVLANDSDPEGAGLTVTPTPVAGAAHGLLILAADGSFNYIHDGGETLSDGFIYEVCESGAPASCSQAAVAITINPINDLPTLGDDSGTVAEGGTLAVAAPGVLANDSDPEGGSLTVSLAPAAPPANGSLTLAADGSYSYTHDGSETTTDGFSYEACDVGGACATAQVSLTITPVNDPPTADAQDFGVAVTAITLTGSDPEGDDLLFELVSGPSAGTLAGLPATEVGGTGVGVTYTPDSSGDPDSFIFRVTDSGSLTGTAEVRIAAGSIGDDDGVEPPELAVIDAKDGFVEVNEDADVNIVLIAAAPLTGVDAIGDLTFSITSAPTNGTLSGLADIAETPVRSAGVLYQPTAGYTGSDSFGFEACEVADPLNCDSATVSIDVVAFAAQQPPVAEDRFFSTEVDDPLTFDLTSSESGSGEPGGDPRANSVSAGAGTSAVTFQGGNEPNLAVSGFSAPACVRVGDPIGSQIQVTVTNNGAVEVPAGQSVSIGFYVSVDPIITTADTLLDGGRENIASIEPDGLQVGESISNFLFSGASVPSSSPLGNLYIGVLADEFDSVTELSESDNRASRAIIIETAGGSCTTPTVLQTLYRLTSLPSGGVLTQERQLPFPQQGTEQVPVQVGEVLNSVSGSPTTILFTPDQGFSGVASFGYTVETQGLTSAPATAEIRVVDPNATTACTTCETLTVAVEGAGLGDVTADPAPDAGAAVCSTGAVCDLEYPPGIAVILQARPAGGLSTFGGWSGCSSSSNPRITVVTGVATSCTATFDSAP